MAVANILGSNIFNIAIILPVDLFYTHGAILSSVSTSHLITAAAVVIMNILVIAGLLLRHKRKTFGVISWNTLAIIGLYVFTAYALF